MTRVLVLGRDGMLGQMVMAVLSRRGSLEVRGTSRRSPADPFHLEVGRDPDVIRRLLARHESFRYLINCIGMRSGQIDEARPESVSSATLVNSLFSQQLAASTAESGARVIQISTDGVFSPDAGICYEDSSCGAPDVYGKTKRLGEVEAPGFLNLRCSIIGPDPLSRRGLIEWLRSQPTQHRVSGYTDHLWNGVTTLQFAELCRVLIEEDLFEAARREGAVHHFCPNETVSKFELVEILRAAFRPDLTVAPTAGPAMPVRRTLDTRHRILRDRFGSRGSIGEAVTRLAAWSGSEAPGARLL